MIWSAPRWRYAARIPLASARRSTSSWPWSASSRSGLRCSPGCTNSGISPTAFIAQRRRSGKGGAAFRAGGEHPRHQGGADGAVSRPAAHAERQAHSDRTGTARGPGVRAKPTTTGDPRLPTGCGETDAWGNILYSLRGGAQDQALVWAHERSHQILTPRLYVLRRMRMQSRMNSYFRSSLSRYPEEALAETAAQMQVHGASPT